MIRVACVSNKFAVDFLRRNIAPRLLFDHLVDRILDDPRACAIFRRMRFSSFAFAAVAVALSALTAPVRAQPTEERDWREIATARDRDRLERWEELFAAAQVWVAKMGGKDSFGNSTRPFSSIPLGRPVSETPDRWAGNRRCRSVSTYDEVVNARSWFRCEIFASNGGWRIEKTTGSVRFQAQLFSDAKLGTVALGGWSTTQRKYTGYSGNGTGEWDLRAMLRHDGARMLRMFVPHELRYEVLEIEVGR